MKKHVLITGSGTGLGREAAIALAHRGHHVYATTQYKREAKLLNKIALIEKIPLKAFKLDIRNKSHRQLVHQYKIDTLINNAAIGESGSVAEVPLKKYRSTFETNVFSNIAITQEVLKDMVKRKEGRVIFITSLAGRMSIPFLSPYAATKYALEAIAGSLQAEMKRLSKKGIYITVSIIEPGLYATGFNQHMLRTKYKWMNKQSYFYSDIKRMKNKDNRFLRLFEVGRYNSIIEKYIEAVEANNPKLRYSEPKVQASFIQILRMLGK
ncbi:SDR family NAD(P)-dependent oxidoreductase [Vallitalea okinawensis]|uniref:SDR family NAD(P)-dependent oxidoreductase n=1 Tax=Vallitalea okinawensis TaxID=2078660 RepID=UPI000CFDC320|nr:SDR family NAD(P)-dependent oxidoreductase [Vallitalea okinawensis]